MQRRNHPKKMDANNKRDDRNHILFRIETIEQHQGANNGDRFQGDEDSVDPSVKTGAMPSERNTRCRDNDRDGDQYGRHK